MDYLESLTPEELEREVLPSFWQAGRPPIKVWQALTQVSNHSTDHRSQMLALIYSMGGPTAGQDCLNYHFATRSTRE